MNSVAKEAGVDLQGAAVHLDLVAQLFIAITAQHALQLELCVCRAGATTDEKGEPAQEYAADGT
jgi:hypothetical protein